VARALACLVSICGWAFTWSALAEAQVRPRAAVIELSIGGTAAPELRAQLERHLSTGLAAGGFDAVGREAVAARLRTRPDLVGCSTTSCLETIGSLLGVDRFVRGRVEAQGAAYTVRLELLSGDRVVRSVERTCPVCTLSEARQLVENAGADLGPKNPNLVSIVVTTEPPGLTVFIDEESRGPAPFELSLPPGRHLFHVLVDGRPAPDQVVEVTPGPEGRPLAVTLRAPPPPVTPPAVVPVTPTDEGPPRWAIWKVTALGAGSAFLLGGIILFAIDGNEVDCADGRPCRLLRETTALAVTSTLVGVGLLGLGGWMIYDDAVRGPRAAAGILPRRGGALVVWGGRF
jgi:hypothetical protein